LIKDPRGSSESLRWILQGLRCGYIVVAKLNANLAMESNSMKPAAKFLQEFFLEKGFSEQGEPDAVEVLE
jgi:hypothetical protein